MDNPETLATFDTRYTTPPPQKKTPPVSGPFALITHSPLVRSSWIPTNGPTFRVNGPRENVY